ncbi:band 4.1-like protein 4A [Xiphias gladius]|uniref:band 4.1-like protein 4A n=1 Tax=Xiphias gladius TaxID=8245 RepID=UPI001A99D904|nr:band 4.1-like protein 4A [Xiphias gladius]
MSLFFQMLDRSNSKRLYRCCVEHHLFFRMSESNLLTRKLKHNSIARSPTLVFPWLNVEVLRNKTINNKTTTDLFMKPKHHTNCSTESVSCEPMTTQAAPPVVQRSEDEPKEDHVKPSAPWENSGPMSGLFNPKFPPNTKEEERNRGRQKRWSRSLDGDRPIRHQRRKSCSRGSTSTGSESERTVSNSERRRRTKIRRSPDVLIWQHIQKHLVEPDSLLDRQTEEIFYKEVRVSGEPIRARRSSRGRRRCRWASASDLHSKTELVPPLPVTKATDTSCRLPINP